MSQKKSQKNYDRFTSLPFFKKNEKVNLYRQKKSEVAAVLHTYADESTPDYSQSPSKIVTLDEVSNGGIMKNKIFNKSHVSNKKIDLLVLIRCDLTDSVLENIEIGTLVLINTDISETTFRKVVCNEIIMDEVIARKADFSEAKMSYSWLRGDFERANFCDATLNHSILIGNFQNTVFVRANLAGSWLRECDIKKANFISAHVSNMRLDLVSTGVRSVTLPDGSKHIPIENDWEKFTKISNKS